MSFDFSFAPAKRTAVDLRVLLCGESGHGKTFTALALAHHLGIDSEKIAVIDSETHEMQDRSLRGSVEKYEGIRCECHRCRGHGITFGAFAQLKLPTDKRDPRDYVEAIRAAGRAGFEVLIVDSITHEWESCKKLVDVVKKRFKGNQWAAWSEITPQHDAFVSTLMDFPGHVIACVRGKEKTEQKGRDIVNRGLLPQQREGIEFEFDVWLNLHDQVAHVAKTRANRLRGRTFREPGLELAEELLEWSRGPTAKAERTEGETKAREARAAIAPKPDRPSIRNQLGVDASRTVAIGASYILTREDVRRIDDVAGTKGKLAEAVGKTISDAVEVQGVLASIKDSKAKRPLANDPHMRSVCIALKECRDARKGKEAEEFARALDAFDRLKAQDLERKGSCGSLGITKCRSKENHSAEELRRLALEIETQRDRRMDELLACGKDEIIGLMRDTDISAPLASISGEDLLVLHDEAVRVGLVSVAPEAAK